MPKKGKKKNKQTVIDDDDWGNSGSEDNASNQKEMNKSDPLQAALAAVGKKKKKGKKGKGGASKEVSTPSSPPADNWDDDEDDLGPPPEVGNKNKKKKNKKKNKNVAFDDEPEPEPELEPEPEATFFKEDDVAPDEDFGGKGGKKKKNKKKKNKGGGGGLDFEAMEAELAALEAEGGGGAAAQVASEQSNKGKKGKKKKGKKVNAQRQKLLEMKKEERQEEVLERYKNLVGSLDEKYDPYFGEESDNFQLFEAMRDEIIEWYGENVDQAMDNEVFNNKIGELEGLWEELMGIMRTQWQEDNAEDLEEQAEQRRERERAERIAQFAAAGMKVGRSNQGPKSSGLSEKQRRKQDEKRRLKEMKARLKEIDLAQKEKEIAQEKEKERQEMERKQKLEADKKAKIAAEKAKQKQQQEDNWDDDDSSSGFGDDSDDSDAVATKKGKSDAKKAPPQPVKKKVVTKFDDDEEEEQQKKKRRRKKKGGNNNNGNNNNNNNNGKKNNNNNNNNSKKKTEVEKSDKKDTKDDDVNGKDEVEEKKEIDGNGDESKTETPKGKEKEKGKTKDKGKEKDKKKKPLRSPICVVMGHVDTGKTLILDRIRHSSVQHGEAGGITQQIGATYLSIDYIKKECERMKEQFGKQKYKVPGLLFIDTPGHESFSNLRQRGSSMCDIAILVVDITGGIEKQTAESLRMLKEGGIPFIVALNKVDTCTEWRADNGSPFQTSFKKQNKNTVRHFEKRLDEVKLDFATHGWNTELYWKNKNMEKDISLVPTSAKTGEGIPDLMFLLTRLTQKYMQKTLTKTKFKCNILEVKTVQGFGSTIDVILSGGTLEAEDTIIVCGMDGPIVSKVRALLLPNEAQEMRVKGEYQNVNEVHASAGVRIAAHNSLDAAVAGSQLLILDRKYRDPNKWKRERKADIEDKCDIVQRAFNNLKSLISKTGRGVYVQASTLGALEALVTFLQSVKVPMCGFNIGDVHKSDVMKASIQKEYQKEYCLILAFNIRVVPDARQMAEQLGVTIFEEEIIYQLHSRFEEYITDIRNAKKDQAKDVAVFPVEMQILSPEHVFNNKNPIVVGVEIIRGTLRVGTPIVVKLYEEHKTSEGIVSIGRPLYLGNVTSIEVDSKGKPRAEQGDKVAVRIEGDDSVKNVQVGRSFALKEKLVSRISRASLDAIKQHFKDELSQQDIDHLGQLKKYFEII